MNDFFSMGGYASYVWSSYGLALVILLINVILPRRNHTRTVAGIARSIKRKMGDRHDTKT